MQNLIGLYQVESGDVGYTSLEERLAALANDNLDDVGAALTDSNSINFTYDGEEYTITADLSLDGSSLVIGVGGVKVGTVDADAATVSNLELDNFKTNVIDTDGTLAENSDLRLATQKAIKTYVDNLLQGIKWKAPVRLTTTEALVGSYDTGVFTATANGALTLDGVAAAQGDRILVKNNTTSNGIYTVTTVGDAETAFVLTRALDADVSAEFPQMAVFVKEGTTSADQGYVLTNDIVTLDTTELVYVQFTGLGQIIAGDGLTKDGNTISVNAGDGIAIVSDEVTIDLDGSSLANGVDGLKVSAVDADSVTVSNIEADNFKAEVIQSTLTDSDTNLPTSGAIVDYVGLETDKVYEYDRLLTPVSTPTFFKTENYTVLAGDLGSGNPVTLTIPNSTKYEYNKGNLMVYINGVFQINGQNYSEVEPGSGDATQVTFVANVIKKAGTVVTYVIFEQPNLDYDVAVTFTGDSVTQAVYSGDIDKTITYTYTASGAAVGKVATETVVQNGTTTVKTYTYNGTTGKLESIASVIS